VYRRQATRTLGARAPFARREPAVDLCQRVPAPCWHGRYACRWL